MWKLSAQIYLPRGDTFTLGSSKLGGLDGLSTPNFEVGDWADLTATAGSIEIKQGYADNDPLSEYEVGTCDLFLKGLTYAPTLNDNIVPGVRIRVLISKDAVVSQFAGVFENDFLTTSVPETQRVLFYGLIQDAVEDRVAGTVTIKATDIWLQVIRHIGWQDVTGVELEFYLDSIINAADPLYDWIDVDYASMTFPVEVYSGQANVLFNSLDENFWGDGRMEGNGSVVLLTPVIKGGPYVYSKMSMDANMTVNRLRATTAAACVPGTATVDTPTGTTFAPTTDFWRYQITLSPNSASPFTFWYIAPSSYIAWAPEPTFETTITMARSALGTFWVRSNGLFTFGGNTVWMDRPSTCKISDVHVGDHLCYTDYVQTTSLSSVLNTIIQHNTNAAGVESTTTFENSASVALYGRRSREVNTSTDPTTWPWSGDQLLAQTAYPESNVSSVDVEITAETLNLLPELLDFVDFENDGVTQKRMVSRRELYLTPKRYEGRIEFFDYLPYE